MKKIHKKAFSLIELSIVLVIIAIVVAGTLSVSTVSVTNAKTKVTIDRMKEIYKAIGQYVSLNQKLPCPASLVLTKTMSGYGSSTGSAGSCSATGVYQSNAASAILIGMVPVATLGLPIEMGEDGFGNKIMYVVSKYFTAADYPSTTTANLGISTSGFSSHLETDNSTIRIMQQPTGNVISGNAVALISYGSNGYGAFKSTATTQTNSTSSDGYEQQNYISNANTAGLPNLADYGVIAGNANYVVITSTNLSSTVFDDIVMFKTRSQMMLEFDSMYMIPCIGGGNYASAYYGQRVFRSTACTTPATVYPSKKCDVYGQWIQEQTCQAY